MPSAADVVTCRFCRAPIRWTTTAAEKPMCVNAEPDEKGNTAVYTDEHGVTRSRSLDGATAPELRPHEWRAMPHAAACTTPRPRTPKPPGPRLSPRPLRRRTAWRQR